MRNGIQKVRSVALILSVALIAFAGFRAEAATQKGRLAEHVSGQYIVKFKSTGIRTKASAMAQSTSLSRAMGRLGTASVQSLQTDDRYAKVTINTKTSTEEVLRLLSANAQVEYAEPNFIYRSSVTDAGARLVADLRGAARSNKGWWDDNGGWWGGDGSTGDTGRTPNDPSFGQLWGMLNSGQADPAGQTGVAGVDIGATRAWLTGTGSREIVVAVIDTGVDYTHEDLVGNIYTNTAEIAANGIDDDNNGFIDDVRGWNFEGHSNDPMDDNRHGTHCSGTIGALGDNNVGVAGVSWNVTIMPLKFLSAQGSGSLSDAVEAIKYATKMHVNIMSNSWGGGGFSKAMEDAIKEARDAGILFIAAAGNESNNNDARPSYPATYQLENVISVAAIDNKDATASWSNYGTRTVHLGAPGVKIYSTIPGNRYEALSGTSMACPHVAGAAALLWSLNRSMTFADVKTRLMATVEPTRALSRKTISGGRLNIANAISGRTPERTGPNESDWQSMNYAVESEHNYASDSAVTYEVSVPGARYIRLNFARIQTESGYDFIKVVDAQGNEIETLTGEMEGYTTAYAEGEKLFIRVESDSSVEQWGFSVDRVDFIR